MSNLLKKGSTISRDERVIDYNELIKEKLQAIMEANAADGRAAGDGFINGLTADVVERLTTDEEDAGQETAVTEEQINIQIQEMKEEAQKLLDNANEQAQQIIEQDQEQIKHLEEEARQRGYKEGQSEALTELEDAKKKLRQEFCEKSEMLEAEYIQRKKQIEPELVDVLTGVFEKVILTVAEDDKSILLHLINSTLENSDKSHEFLIKTSPEDYKFLINNQGKIYCAMTKEITLEITPDETLERNQCIIETDGGVFNCSLDIELNNLIKKIKMLSCMD